MLYAPRHVVTDSQQRLIISDPSGNALHVLDPKGKTSFRIVCGKDPRLREPSGVAVDAADNIYVADAERGFVVVSNTTVDSSGISETSAASLSMRVRRAAPLIVNGNTFISRIGGTI